MDVRAEAPPGEVVVTLDPLALVKRVARKSWPWAAGLVGVLTVLGSVFRHQLNWGDFPTWVVAITTLLAFLAAAFAGLVAYNLLGVETTRDLKAAEQRLFAAEERKRLADERAAQREAERRAQASKITAWFNFFEVLRPNDTLEGTWGATVDNTSELPILDVRIFYYRVNDPHDGSPWTTEQRYASIDRIRVIPPGQSRNQELPRRVRNMAQECNNDVYLVGIEFTDANGIRWFRDERGALHDPNTRAALHESPES
jgi:hypothetical protein